MPRRVKILFYFIFFLNRVIWRKQVLGVETMQEKLWAQTSSTPRSLIFMYYMYLCISERSFNQGL